ncbi:MAG: sodium:glutamate symporter [Clostridiales bacterium]|nr:sodium:glutamate symporter [Clostridiales bacterium]
MDFSAYEIWALMIQIGILLAALLLANFMRQSSPQIKKTLMPVAVIAGFLLLALKYIFRGAGIELIDGQLYEKLVYHAIALGFIAMSLRTTDDADREGGTLTGVKSGAIIVSSYLVQGIVGLSITILLAKTFMPTLFPAAGMLLPMGFGQGPGQANNVGTTYEMAGFTGGRSFGLSVAACGYIVACTVGVIILNVLRRRNKLTIRKEAAKEQELSVGFFQGEDELPVSDSIDRLSIQVALIFIVYMLTYFVTIGLTTAFNAIGIGNMLNSILWGFNFIIGSAVAILVRICFKQGQKKNIIKKQYQNNYLLNRMSGFFFDIMIVAGIASIEIEDLKGLFVPFILICAAGAVVTWFWLTFVCKKVYDGYYYEGLLSMFGMMTGTIGSGVLLLREIDPNYETPAANNLILGSSFGILFGAPMLVLIGIAKEGLGKALMTVGILLIYLAILIAVILLAKPKSKKD